MTEQHDEPSGTGASPGSGPRVSAAQMRDVKRLRRTVKHPSDGSASSPGRHIAGVAGGIARHFDVDPLLVRVLLLVLVFMGGTGLLVYGAAWLMVPEEGSDKAIINLGEDAWSTAFLVVLGVAGLMFLGNGWAFGWSWVGGPVGVPWPLAIVGLIVFLIWYSRNQQSGSGGPPQSGGWPQSGTPYSPPPPPGAPYAAPPGAPYAPPSEQSEATTEPVTESGSTQSTYARPGEGETAAYAAPPPHTWYTPQPPAPPPPKPPKRDEGPALFGITAAAVALVLGCVGVYHLAVGSVPAAAYPAAALAVIGIAMVVGAFAGRSTGLGVAGSLVAGALALAAVLPHLSIGEIDREPLYAAELESRYELTAGAIRLDLTDIRDPEALDGRHLDVEMWAGEVLIDVPDDVDLDVTSSIEGGQLDVLDRVVEGRAVENNRSTPDTDDPDLSLDIDVTYGRAVVTVR